MSEQRAEGFASIQLEPAVARATPDAGSVRVLGAPGVSGPPVTPAASGGPHGPHAWSLVQTLSFVAKLLVASLLVLYAFYLVAGNALLAARVIPKLATSEDSFVLEHGRAYTLVPGVVHVQDLVIVGIDDSMEWQLGIDEAEVHIELGELLVKRFHVTEARTDGTSFKLRFRLDPAEVGSPRAALLPAILGRDDPPIRLASVPDERTEEEKAALWSVSIDSVLAAVDLVHLDVFRMTGSIGLRAGFQFAPLRDLAIGRAVLGVRGARVDVGERTVFQNFDSGATFAMGSLKLDPSPDAAQVISAISGVAFAHHDVTGFEAASEFLPAGMRLSDGDGHLRLGVGVERGEFVPGSSVTFSTPHVRFELAAPPPKPDAKPAGKDDPAARPTYVTVDSSLDASVVVLADRVAGAVSARGIAARVDLEAASGKAAKVTPAAASADRVVARFSREGRSMRLMIDQARATLDAPGVRVPDLAPVGRLMPRPDGFALTAGSATLSAFASIDAKSVKLRGDVGSPETRWAWRSMRIRHDARAKFELAAPRGGDEGLRFEGSGRVWVRDAELDRDALIFVKHTEHEWINTDAKKLVLGPDGFHATFETTARTSKPVAMLLAEANTMPDWLAPLFDVDDMRGTVKLSVDDAGVTLEMPRVRAGGIRVDGFVRSPKGGGPAMTAVRIARLGGVVGIASGIPTREEKSGRGGLEIEPGPDDAWLVARRRASRVGGAGGAR